MSEHTEDDDSVDDEDDEWKDECWLLDDGQCLMAGSEHCDFCCPKRDSEFFAGSRAWCKKHGEPHE
jgi:hypothetical protein